MKSKSFSDIDILVLGIFVQPGLIGVYSIAWTIAKVLNIFSSGISTTIFPEISKLSMAGETESVSDIVELAICYAGLVTIPGLVGGIILAEPILRIYGPEFVAGSAVFATLIFSVLAYGYQKPLINTLNGIDRPDLAFRVNLIFVILNVAFNVAFVYWIGWVGAAIATASSATIATVLAFWYVSAVINFSVPIVEILRQVLAAGVMGGFIILGQTMYRTLDSFTLHATFTVGFAVGSGAVIYLLIYAGISPRFRSLIAGMVPSTTSVN